MKTPCPPRRMSIKGCGILLRPRNPVKLRDAARTGLITDLPRLSSRWHQGSWRNSQSWHHETTRSSHSYANRRHPLRPRTEDTGQHDSSEEGLLAPNHVLAATMTFCLEQKRKSPYWTGKNLPPNKSTVSALQQDVAIFPIPAICSRATACLFHVLLDRSRKELDTEMHSWALSEPNAQYFSHTNRYSS